MKRTLILLVSWLALAPVAACTDTLTQMRESLPSTATFWIDGQVTEVPVMLPEGDALPILQVRMRYDLDERAVNAAYPSRYPMQYAGRPAPAIHVDAWPETGECRPQEPVSAVREWGLAQPEACDIPQNRPSEILHDMLRLAGAPNADVRVLYQIASSSARVDGVPLPSFGGMWKVQFEQWLEGAPLFTAPYNPTPGWKQGWADEMGERRYLFWPYQNICMTVRAEDDLTASIYMLFEAERKLTEDTELAPLEKVVRTVQARIDAGKLRSVHALRLGYTNFVTAQTDRPAENAERVHVLVPAWQVLGYDTKDAPGSVLELGPLPDAKEGTLCVRGSAGAWPAELRIDARDARVLEDYRYGR